MTGRVGYTSWHGGVEGVDLDWWLRVAVLRRIRQDAERGSTNSAEGC
jgi:hypothetical protein